MGTRDLKVKTECFDAQGWNHNKAAKFVKRTKNRRERRRARRNPECQHGYGRYSGWYT